jgi:hypothetical protein
LSKNLTLFNKRFPSLFETLKPFTENFSINTISDFEIIKAQCGDITAKYKGSLLHSIYNPVKECEKLSKTNEISNAETLVFYGFGLGYLPNICASLYTEKNIVLIEPDPLWILVAFTIVDWTPVFNHISCVFFYNAQSQTIISILEQFGLEKSSFIALESQIAHKKNYFENIQELVKRNKQKKNINEATLERFSHLWLRNLCRNINGPIANYGGICKYKNFIKSQIPALILAAGPSLEQILPQLSELKKRCIIICVDTALRACTSVGVQPHFIILVDPQYWNSRHLDRIKAPESILITESATYPSVFRFQSRETILCTSMFPLGQYIEQFLGKNGILAAGGSVASSAWDFARYIGCTTILTAGLDLGFPNKKTHAKGSTFEERTIRLSNRLQNTETTNAHSLHSTTLSLKSDFNGKDLLSDTRMNMYAWWFESKCAQFLDIKTKTITPDSLFIPGISIYSIKETLSLPIKTNEIETLLKKIPEETIQTKEKRNKALEFALKDISKSLNELKDFAENAITICDKAITICNKTLNTTQISTNVAITEAFDKLKKIDIYIKQSKASSLASLVYPSTKKLDKICKQAGISEETTTAQNYRQKCIYSFLRSKIMYSEINKAVNLHFSLLFSQVPKTQSDNITVRMHSSKTANS